MRIRANDLAHFLCAIGLGLLAGVALHAQTPTRAQLDAILDRAKAEIAALFTPPTPAVTVVTANLQAAIDKAAAGDTLTFGYAESAPIAISKPLTLRGTSGAALKGGLTIVGPGTDVVSVSNVDIWKLQQTNDVVVLSGANILLSDVRVHGGPNGQKRGILGNARTLTLRKVTIDGIWLPDQDSQAFACWDGCIDVLIEDPIFSGAGETLLIGGADSSAPAMQPRNITIRGSSPGACVLTKDLAWRRPGYQVKATLEFKSIVGFLVENCYIGDSWQSAQDGYLILLTPRNQDGRAPWSSVEQGIIRHNTGGHAAGFLLASGRDTDKDPITGLRRVSGTLHDVQVMTNTMDGFDPSVWRSSAQWGTNKLIQIMQGPVNLTISGNVLSGAHYDLTPSGNSVEGAALYFDEAPPKLVNFTFTNNTVPKSTYYILGGNSSPQSAWADYVASGTLSGNVAR